MNRRDGALDLLKWLALCRWSSIIFDMLVFPSIGSMCQDGWRSLVLSGDGGEPGAKRRQCSPWRYLGWLLLFSAVSEIAYRLFFPAPATLNVMPTLVLGLLVARGWQASSLEARSLAAGALLMAALFSSRLMFGFFGVLLPLAMLLVFRRPWYFAWLPGLVCVAANQWRVLYGAAWLGMRWRSAGWWLA